MPEPRKLRVFLCHSSQDKPVVRELYQKLLAEGWIDPWFDKDKLLPGQAWEDVIEQAVEDSDVVITCLSNGSVSKEGFVQRELRYALAVALEKPEETVFIIPFRLDDCQVPRSLRNIQWVNYFGVEKNNSYEGLIQSLKLRLEQILRKVEEERARKDVEENARREEEGALYNVRLWTAGPNIFEVVKVICQLTTLDSHHAVLLGGTVGGIVLSSVNKDIALIAQEKLLGAGASAVVEKIPKYNLLLMDTGPRVYEVINLISKLTGLGLNEAKTLAQTMNSFILSSVSRENALTAKRNLELVGALVAIYPVSDNLELPEEVPIFDIVVRDTGPKKIEIIKAIRQISNLGLGEAKNLAETNNYKVLSSAEIDVALKAKMQLQNAGATVELIYLMNPMPTHLDAGIKFDVILRNAGLKIIDVIKIIRQFSDIGLGEAKTLAETKNSKVLSSVNKSIAASAKKRFDTIGAVVDIVLTENLGVIGQLNPLLISGSFDVVIKDCGEKKIEVIKVIRQLTSLGLGEAKSLAESSNGKVLSLVDANNAVEGVRQLEAAGAVVEIVKRD